MPFYPPSKLSREAALKEAREELESLIGLTEFKTSIKKLQRFVKTQEQRKARGIETDCVMMHMCLTGPPGTCKTTLARILARLLYGMGILRTDAYFEGQRSEIVGAWIGHSEAQTTEALEQTLGGLLFIDEAYSLAEVESANDFGHVVIPILVKFMEDYRDDFVLVVAGYKERMESFLDANDGMRQRIPWNFHIAGYTPHELCQIFDEFVWNGGYVLTPEAKAKAAILFHVAWAQQGPDFSNGRFVRNVYERAEFEQGARLGGKGTDLELRTITDQDISNEEFTPDFSFRGIDFSAIRWRMTCPLSPHSGAFPISALAANQKCKCGESLEMPWWSIDIETVGGRFERLMKGADYKFTPAAARVVKPRPKRQKPEKRPQVKLKSPRDRSMDYPATSASDDWSVKEAANKLKDDLLSELEPFIREIIDESKSAQPQPQGDLPVEQQVDRSFPNTKKTVAIMIFVGIVTAIFAASTYAGFPSNTLAGKTAIGLAALNIILTMLLSPAITWPTIKQQVTW